MKNQVTKSAFLEWYFSDNETINSIGDDVVSSLNESGEFIITIQDIFNNCGFIPRWLCVDNGENEGLSMQEYSPKDIELINDCKPI
jgi:hypothetical protein